MNIAQAKAAVSVEEVIGTRVDLQRRGAVLVGPRPFHQDSGRPNLVVFPRTQTWQCFACGAQGDVIDFLTRIEGVSVREAIAMVGHGITGAPRTPRCPAPPENGQRRGERRRIQGARGPYAPVGTPPRGPSGPRLHARGDRSARVPQPHAGTHRRWQPVRDRAGRIAGCQVRPNKSSRGKYLWLSSAGKPGGASSGAPCHYAKTSGTQLWITEGPLKADLVAARLGQPCLGVAGVANWRSAMPMLEGVREVVLAFDEDQPGPAREAVEANARAFQALAKRGVKVLKATWDWSQAKGIDDALQAGVEIEITRGGAA